MMLTVALALALVLHHRHTPRVTSAVPATRRHLAVAAAQPATRAPAAPTQRIPSFGDAGYGISELFEVRQAA